MMMRTTVMFLVAPLAIVAMSRFIDDFVNDVGNLTDGDASNDTNTTLDQGW